MMCQRKWQGAVFHVQRQGNKHLCFPVVVELLWSVSICHWARICHLPNVTLKAKSLASVLLVKDVVK